MKRVTAWSPFDSWEFFHGCSLVISRGPNGELRCRIGAVEEARDDVAGGRIRRYAGDLLILLLRRLGARQPRKPSPKT